MQQQIRQSRLHYFLNVKFKYLISKPFPRFRAHASKWLKACSRFFEGLLELSL